MFGISFSELLLVALIALVVLGPDRLPGAARTTGLWLGRLKRAFNSIKSDIEREIGTDEIRRQLHNEDVLAIERQAREKLDIRARPAYTAVALEPQAQIGEPQPNPEALADTRSLEQQFNLSAQDIKELSQRYH